MNLSLLSHPTVPGKITEPLEQQLQWHTVFSVYLVLLSSRGAVNKAKNTDFCTTGYPSQVTTWIHVHLPLPPSYLLTEVPVVLPKKQHWLLLLVLSWSESPPDVLPLLPLALQYFWELFNVLTVPQNHSCAPAACDLLYPLTNSETSIVAPSDQFLSPAKTPPPNCNTFTCPEMKKALKHCHACLPHPREAHGGWLNTSLWPIFALKK